MSVTEKKKKRILEVDGLLHPEVVAEAVLAGLPVEFSPTDVAVKINDISYAVRLKYFLNAVRKDVLHGFLPASIVLYLPMIAEVLAMQNEPMVDKAVGVVLLSFSLALFSSVGTFSLIWDSQNTVSNDGNNLSEDKQKAVALRRLQSDLIDYSDADLQTGQDEKLESLLARSSGEKLLTLALQTARKYSATTLFVGILFTFILNQPSESLVSSHEMFSIPLIMMLVSAVSLELLKNRYQQKIISHFIGQKQTPADLDEREVAAIGRVSSADFGYVDTDGQNHDSADQISILG